MTDTTVLSDGLLWLGLMLGGTLVVSLALLVRRLRTLEAEVQARTLELHEARAKLAQLAVTDPLTGLASRQTFDERLAIECRRAQREFSPLTLVKVDVDCLAAYNAAYGQAAADTCLQQVATTVAGIVSRPGDLVARFNGDTFALLLPSTNEKVVHLAERCRQAVADLALPHAHCSTGAVVTISAGVATLQPSAELTPDNLIAASDRALQQAKAEGRNRCVGVAEGLGELPVTLTH